MRSVRERQRTGFYETLARLTWLLGTLDDEVVDHDSDETVGTGED